MVSNDSNLKIISFVIKIFWEYAGIEWMAEKFPVRKGQKLQVKLQAPHITQNNFGFQVQSLKNSR